MKIITSYISILFTLTIPRLMAQDLPQPSCHFSDSSLNVLGVKPVIEDMQTRVMKSACDEKLIFTDISKREGGPDHTPALCEQIKLCSAGLMDEASTKEAREALKDYLPKAALLGVLTKEIKENKIYNIRLKFYEEETKEKACPDEVIDSKCEKDIRQAFAETKTVPGNDESIESFVSNTFFVLENKYKRGGAPDKKTLQEQCQNKISFNKICKMKEERLKEIEACEKNSKSKDCLDQEQDALASLVSKHLAQKPLFYALEKELCLSTRVVQNPIDRVGSLSANSMSLRRFGSAPRIQINSTSTGQMMKTESISDEDSDVSSSAGSNRPDESAVIHNESLKMDIDKSTATTSTSSKEEIKGFENSDGSTLSETFSSSLKESVLSDSNRTIINNNPGTSTWTSDFSSRFNTITEADKKKKEAEEEKKKLEQDKLADDSNLSPSEKKKLKEKKEDMNALMAQISGLKAKLEEMSQKVEDLKAKKEVAGVSKEKDDKEALEREKSIFDLRKKIAELEADKKKKEADMQLIAQNEENARARAALAQTPSAPSTFSNRSDNGQVEANREREKVASNFIANASSYSEGRAPASVSNSYSSQGTASAIVLKVAGSQATPDSAVVYMTANELQKYPFHLSDTASSTEIEKMLKGNNGASIILGDSEQIIPIMENGVVVVDENGNVKYKRVKISLVKNEKERKQNIAREISSIADLKREEQKKRDLVRYQEMKKALKIK